MKNIFFAYLHSCWFSHAELTHIFSDQNSAESFYMSLCNETLKKYVKNTQRRQEIVEKYNMLEGGKKEKNKILNICEKLWVEIIILADDNYPESLKNIPHTPYVIYVRWWIPQQDMFAVVWSRKVSPYGIKVIDTLIPDIAQIFPIVSGWAAWCDTQAHKACIASWNKTVVVVGTGIDQTYPASNEKLFNSVVENNWAVISIFRIGEPWNPYNFPVRNEIVVWLSRWVLVVEAKNKSGSLITAWLCLDAWKDLFSVPGDILSKNYSGTNMLIKKWEAKCVTHSLDILEEYNITIKQYHHKEKLVFWDKDEEQIYESISMASQNIDQLSDSLNILPQQVLIKASLLELKWVVKKDLLWKYELI